MVEILDKSTNQKMMAMVICGISYGEEEYLIYSIRRDDVEANLFLSKLVKSSLGYIISSDFDNGEKEVMDLVVKRFINRENKEKLESDGFSIIKEIVLSDELSFDVDKCYVSTVLRSLVKDCLIHYELVNEKMFKQPVVEVIDDTRKFNEGFVSNVLLIILGFVVVVFSGMVIWRFFVG